MQTEEQIDVWLEQVTKGLPSEKILAVFNEVLKSVSQRASRSLNRLTLMAIVNRVLYQCNDIYPLLRGIVIDDNGFNIDLSRSQFLQADPEELKQSFRFLFIELFGILGDLTADVITSDLKDAGEETIHLQETNDEKAKLRLDVLYEISRIFACFESVETTFPEIFKNISSLFSFKTITLLEKKTTSTLSSIWFDSESDQDQLNRAVLHAQNLYEYLVCPITHECLTNPQTRKYRLSACSFKQSKNLRVLNRYITLPLTLSSLETFGVLQFECLEPMQEADLRFINSLTNFIAVTLDRYNKEQESEYVHQLEISKRVRELDDAQLYAMNLEKERELREQFVATLTHDLRTPLTTAKISAQCILRKPDNIEKNQQLSVKIIRSIDRMDQMIRDLLDTSRVRAGETLSLTMNLCDLRELTLMTLRELGAAYSNRFILESERESIWGHWNEDGLRRVIENLASNAVKYGLPQQLIKVSLEQNKETAKIIVHNFGNPILADELQKLFEPFQRSHSAQNGHKKGWGLGLTLVKGVVEAHGGSVSVSSSQEEGTKFIVTLPKDSRPFQILN